MITPRLFSFFICLLLVINILCFSILIAGLNRFTSTLITVDLPDTTAGDTRGWTGGRSVPLPPFSPPPSLRPPPLNSPSTPLPPSSLVGAARASPAQNVPPFPPPFSSPPAPHLPTPSYSVRYLRYAFRWL